MTVFDIILFAFVLFPIVDWLAVVILHRVVQRFPHIDTLRERRLVALAIAALTTAFAGLGLARLGHIDINDAIAAMVIFVSVASLSVVNLLFVIRYWSAAWADDDAEEP